MATIKFYYRSKRENAPITIRLIHKKEFDIFANTQLRIDKKNWDTKNGKPKSKDENARVVKTKLVDLENTILNNLNTEYNQGELIDKNWLTYQVDLFFKRVVPDDAISEILTDNIERILATSSTRKNGKGGIGISEGRKKNYNALKKIVIKFQGNKRLKTKDINIKFKNIFLVFMNKERYSDSYSLKMLSNIKTVCNDAKIYGAEVSPQLDKVEIVRPKNKYIIYLTPQDIEKIENASLNNNALENARKWLLIGCNIGQRAGDLLSLNKTNLVNRNGLELIEFQQDKTDKLMTIPIPPNTKELLKSGFPEKISVQNFNIHIKEICRLANINERIKGSILSKETKRKESGTFPKHKLITSHVCRRSYATNLYGVMPTSMIMRITGHTTERAFFGYIGKSGMDYAQQIAEFYSQMAVKENNTPQQLTNKLKAI